MATTSVNISGSAPLNNIEDIKKYFSDEIDYLVIEEEKTSNVSSTVVDVTNDNIKVFDIYENNLYNIEMELRQNHYDEKIISSLSLLKAKISGRAVVTRI